MGASRNRGLKGSYKTITSQWTLIPSTAQIHLLGWQLSDLFLWTGLVLTCFRQSSMISVAKQSLKKMDNWATRWGLHVLISKSKQIRSRRLAVILMLSKFFETKSRKMDLISLWTTNGGEMNVGRGLCRTNGRVLRLDFSFEQQKWFKACASPVVTCCHQSECPNIAYLIIQPQFW